MYRKILLCYDGTIEGRRALRQGAEVAMAMNADAYLLAIRRNLIGASVPEGVTPELVACEQQSAQALLAEGVQWLKDRGVHTEGSLVYGDPLQRIPQLAASVGADLVVVGHRARGRLARWWSESDEATLLQRLHCSILIAVASGAP